MPDSLHASLLQLWDDGALASPGERGLFLLRLAAPALSEEARGELTVGQRDAALLDLHERLFGGVAGAVGDCTACGEPIEFDVTLRDIRVAPAAPVPEMFHLAWSGRDIAYRLPRARDLARLGAAGAIALPRAARALARSCVAVWDDAMGEEGEAAVEAAIAACVRHHDPQALVTVAFACPACGAAGSAPFDIVTFLWRRIDAYLRGLLREVHVIASHYGWSEHDIVALSPWRRRHYLALIGA